MSGMVQGRPPATSAQATSRRTSIRALLAVNFVATLGFSIVLPFLVYLVTRLGGNALVYGAVGAAYSLFQLVGAPVLGRWSDRYGRKRILLLSQLGSALSWAIFLLAIALPRVPIAHVDSRLLGSFTLTIPLLAVFAARALDGVTGGNASVANAYLADVTTRRDRARDFGRLAVSANLGFIAGPALASLLGMTAWGEGATVLAAFAISLAACGMIAFGLADPLPGPPEGLPQRAAVPRVLGHEIKDCFRGREPSRPSLSAVARLRGVPRLLALDLLIFLAFNLFYVALPIHLARELRWPLARTGVFFAVLSLLLVVVEGPVLARARRHASERFLLLGGSALLAVSFPFFGAQATGLLYLGTLLLALGNGLAWPSLLALLSQAAGDEAQGVVQGLAGSCGAVASIVGLLVGGALYGSLGWRVFALAALVAGLVCVVGLGIPGASDDPASGSRDPGSVFAQGVADRLTGRSGDGAKPQERRQSNSRTAGGWSAPTRPTSIRARSKFSPRIGACANRRNRASCPTWLRASAIGPWKSRSGEAWTVPVARAPSKVWSAAKNRSTSRGQSRGSLSCQVSSPATSERAQSRRSPRWARISSALRLSGAARTAAKLAGAFRSALAAR